MERLKLLLVDDEQMVHRGMRALTDWESLGVGEITSAYYVAEAVELARKLRPELILTDIRMPGADGFSLIEQLQNELPEASFVVLSGYDQFEYAQRALSMGVSAYLLKPVSEAELRRVIESCVKKHREAHERTQMRAELRRYRESARNYTAELILRGAIQGNTGLSEEQLRAAVIGADPLFAGGTYGLCCFLPVITTEFEDEVNGFEKVQEIGGLVARVAGERYPGLSRFVLPGFPVLTLFIAGKELPLEELCGEVARAAREVFDVEVRSVFDAEVGRLVRLPECHEKLLARLEQREGATERAPKTKIEEIKEYIRENLGNREISLSKIAGQFYYNSSYLSRMFKEETGMLFLDFLNRERIAYAQRLIDGGVRSTYEVCEKVGYKDYRYFISIFKKYAGMTPYQYVQSKEKK